MKNAFNKLKKKVAAKAKQFPDIDISGLDAMTKLKEFDDTYQLLCMALRMLKSFMPSVIHIHLYQRLRKNS